MSENRSRATIETELHHLLQRRTAEARFDDVDLTRQIDALYAELLNDHGIERQLR
ncbi:MAG: hypothetical protein KME02_12790 [Aphanothece saxicola GSE-SYN-MK-01-06B]|jgi:hypothetical protein|nr:hypothetical protein [Aphanothece saxicola GSE-SYN-MK-01-06B]